MSSFGNGCGPWVRSAVGIAIALVALGCDMNASIRSLQDKAPKGPDFLRTEIIENGPAIADGVSELIVLVHLKNSDGSVVKHFKPTYEIAAGAGVNGVPCTSSSDQGVAICILRATQAGVKRVRLTNAKTGLERDVTFVRTNSRQTADVKSGTQLRGKTAAGYGLNLSVGAPAGQLKLTTSRGYRAYLSVHSQGGTQ